MSKKGTKWLAAMSTSALLAVVAAGCGTASTSNGDTNGQAAGGGSTKSDEKVTISLLIDNTQDSVNMAKGVVAAFEKKNPNIHVETETRPGGSEGDNLVKTRMATGDMTDVFFYNSGSLMQALNPETNLLDLTNEPFQTNVIDSFKPTVSFKGKIYAGPIGSTMAGGWFYNKKIYADLALSVPKTWAELMANSEKIKAAGITPVIGSYKDDWTTQLVVLADYYNVQAADPKFADDYTTNKAKYATDAAAFRSFEKLEEIAKKGYINKDFLATTYDAGLKMLAEGKGAQYPMLSFATPALQQNFPDKMKDIGFFAQPGDNAASNGLTVWMPSGAYIYKSTKHPEQAKKFVEFIASLDGVAAQSEASVPSGPYAIKGSKLPDNVAQAVKDMAPYFDTNKTAPALEFVSPIKGSSLPQITTEVGAGIKSGKQGAEVYDKDVEKQAKQLGLQGW
ncbi:ABC transporter substrate-binding protein [Paenibacillus aceris]|uniref:Raffinose/stachyose/melibiose transport system substrate-binding protein n=1 Tax=Paenibacillus aceris TaxID=869555 RepID=A0ABS4I3I7_9BACL|nr:extracellular solute-binding protein [Paenibacillus aceris]MBP1965473.1 raffinose/stachyose/melibiose transport system substrate-binding protein [Paenibacillus aceris]NHW33477.1 extracellular solute-binding protein [Paenibacillus aceris]